MYYNITIIDKKNKILFQARWGGWFLMYEDKFDDQKIDNEEKLDNEDKYENEEIIEKDKIPEDIPLSIYKEEGKKKKKFKGSLLSYMALALVASFIGGFISTYMGPGLYDKVLSNPKSNEYLSQTVNINPNDDMNTVSAVVKKAIGSVVGITTLETQEFMFGPRDVEGLGSGVIVDSNGYILTNSHVVANGNAKEITVLLDNGDKIAGSVLWSDPLLDLAIVKVDITNLPAATLGDSDKLEVGELAVAIGNPLGLEFQRSVTSGIISGLNRSVQVDANNVIEDLIQTDASINPGNSGGPLLNKSGEVIGINTAKIQSAEGLGFSIPINTTKGIIDEVIDKGSYKAVQLGIEGMEIKDFQNLNRVDMDLEKGVIVLGVQEGSPAEKAKIEKFDLITKLDDVEIESMEGLKKLLYNYREGDQVTLSILRVRDNEEIQIELQF